MCGTVIRVDMYERSHAFHGIGGVRQGNVPSVDLVILTPHSERQAISRRYHDRGRPDFNVELDWFAWCQGPFFVVAVPGTVGERSRWVELAMRGAQPADTDWGAWIVRANKGHFLILG